MTCPIRGDTSAKSADLILVLSADSGYHFRTTTRVSADQWGEICTIVDRPDSPPEGPFSPSPGSWFSYSTSPTLYRCLWIDHCTILFEDEEGDRYMGSSTEDFVPVHEAQLGHISALSSADAETARAMVQDVVVSEDDYVPDDVTFPIPAAKEPSR